MIDGKSPYNDESLLNNKAIVVSHETLTPIVSISLRTVGSDRISIVLSRSVVLTGPPGVLEEVPGGLGKNMDYYYNSIHNTIEWVSICVTQ